MKALCNLKACISKEESTPQEKYYENIYNPSQNLHIRKLKYDTEKITVRR